MSRRSFMDAELSAGRAPFYEPAAHFKRLSQPPTRATDEGLNPLVARRGGVLASRPGPSAIGRSMRSAFEPTRGPSRADGRRGRSRADGQRQVRDSQRTRRQMAGRRGRSDAPGRPSRPLRRAGRTTRTFQVGPNPIARGTKRRSMPALTPVARRLGQVGRGRVRESGTCSAV